MKGARPPAWRRFHQDQMHFSFHRQSESFAPWALATRRVFASKDITAVISVRAHENNPWIAERLDLMAGFYQPAPRILVVDFGSKAPFAEIIRERCAAHGFIYHPVDDQGVFSLSIARNEGACRAETDLLYFTDIDFFSAPDHFERLADYANLHDFGIVRDIVLNVPAYHLTEPLSNEFAAVPAAERLRYAEQLGAIAAGKSRGELTEFIAPYSNNFLCTRDFFRIVGGYDSSFRGHGSEDFELMVRMSHHTRQATLPEQIQDDLHPPTRPSFFGPRPYAGFRRLGEAVSYRAESAGFRAFHLWHPAPESDPWRNSNDWGRLRLKSSLARYVDEPQNLIDIDFLKHPKTALCVCKNSDHGGYFLPFRTLGYRLLTLKGETEKEMAEARDLIANRKVDAFMIFNPYMKSHERFHSLFLLAKEVGIEVVVAERGALPATVYYAADVSYNDPDFTDYDNNPPAVDENALQAADDICGKIRSGSWTLEKLSDYGETIAAYAALAQTGRTKVFIPLQLADDMAVTRFVRPTQVYADFEASIGEVARQHPQVTFVVKAHPLNRDAFPQGPDNIVVCKNDENVHAVIDSCDATVCYNSGVGLLSLIHGKPTVTIGNAFYNMEGAGRRAENLAEAIAMIADGTCGPPAPDSVRRFIAWLVTRKYSFFKAEDDIREFKHRNSHGYKDIMITHLNWNGVSMPLGRISALEVIGGKSYVNGRLGLSIGTDVGWFDNPKSTARGPIKSFLIRWVKKPVRRFFNTLKAR